MGHLEVLQLLVHYHASLEAVDDNGLTALLWAADRGHVACVKALLEANIDVNAMDKVNIDFSCVCFVRFSYRFVFGCLFNDTVPKMRILFHCCYLLCFFVVNLQNSYTALHRSSNAGNLEIVQALVAGKADVLRVDKVNKIFLFCTLVTPLPHHELLIKPNCLCYGILSYVLYVPRSFSLSERHDGVRLGDFSGTLASGRFPAPLFAQ